METVIKVRRLHFKDKLSQRAIAERLGISRTTVRKYLKQYSPKPLHLHVPVFTIPNLGISFLYWPNDSITKFSCPSGRDTPLEDTLNGYKIRDLKASIVQFQLLSANLTNNINHRCHQHSSNNGLHLQRRISLIGALRQYKFPVRLLKWMWPLPFLP